MLGTLLKISYFPKFVTFSSSSFRSFFLSLSRIIYSGTNLSNKNSFLSVSFEICLSGICFHWRFFFLRSSSFRSLHFRIFFSELSFKSYWRSLSFRSLFLRRLSFRSFFLDFTFQKFVFQEFDMAPYLYNKGLRSYTGCPTKHDSW